MKKRQTYLAALQWLFLLVTLIFWGYMVYGYAASADGVSELFQDRPITILEWGMVLWLLLHLILKKEHSVARLLPCVGLTVCRAGMFLASWVSHTRYPIGESWMASWNGYEYSGLPCLFLGIVLCICMTIATVRRGKASI